jgi:hypothetical protein
MKDEDLKQSSQNANGQFAKCPVVAGRRVNLARRDMEIDSHRRQNASTNESGCPSRGNTLR